MYVCMYVMMTASHDGTARYVYMYVCMYVFMLTASHDDTSMYVCICIRALCMYMH
jgi:hypothetical protein